jgi:hypothetical protein
LTAEGVTEALRRYADNGELKILFRSTTPLHNCVSAAVAACKAAIWMHVTQLVRPGKMQVTQQESHNHVRLATKQAEEHAEELVHPYFQLVLQWCHSDA